MRLIIMLFTAFVTLNGAHAETFGETRAYFKDWLAACRPTTNYCSAITYINPNPDNGAVADHWLRIGRHQTGNAWEVSITPIKVMPSNTTTFYFGIGEESYWFTKGETALAFGAINDIFLTGDTANNLLTAMLAGNRMNASFDDESNQPVNIEFSLSGLTAAMLWIDDQQDRVGDSRVAGDLPIGLESAEPQLDLPAKIPSQVLAKHNASNSCDQLEDLIHGPDWQVHQVNNETLLYMLPCTAGAYNFSHAFYTQSTSTGEVSRLLFADYWDSIGWTGTDILFNVGYDPQTRKLSSYYKGRGLGDCGTSGEWQWQEYGFKMLKFFAKSECDGYEDGADLSFPQIYPAN